MKKLLFCWLILVCVVTFVCVACYGVEQQQNRQGVDEPLVQLAEDTSNALGNGAAAASLVQSNKIELSQSLAAFVMVFDSNQKLIASSAAMKGGEPVLPEGFLSHVPLTGDNRLTWQPHPGLRFATVAVRYGGANPGFVVSGRSLREVEQRIDRIGSLIIIGWCLGAVGFFIILLILRAVFGFWKDEKETRQ